MANVGSEMKCNFHAEKKRVEPNNFAVFIMCIWVCGNLYEWYLSVHLCIYKFLGKRDSMYIRLK